jgi:hypothetical protein
MENYTPTLEEVRESFANDYYATVVSGALPQPTPEERRAAFDRFVAELEAQTLDKGWQQGWDARAKHCPCIGARAVEIREGRQPNA